MSKFEVKPLLEKYPDARYYFLLGGRGCGKTYPTLKEAIQDAIDGNGVFAYVRRYKESLVESDMRDLTAPHGIGSDTAWIEEYTNGQYNKVGYYRRYWYLERWQRNEDGELRRVARNPIPIGRALALSTWETDKGSDFGSDKGGIAHIILDEALSAGGNYLRDEWSMFQNVISSLVRNNWEKDTKIWMLANPVSKYGGQYLRNLGITKKMMQNFGTTLLEYPDEDGKPTGTSCVFVYIKPAAGDDQSVDTDATNTYRTFFAFPASRQKSRAITHGFWEMDDATLLDSGIYTDSTKSRTIYLTMDEELLAVDFMQYKKTGVHYLFIRPAAKIRDRHYFVTLESSLSRYAVIAFGNHPITEAFKKIYLTNQVYYSDLSSADIFHAFMKACKLHAV